MLVTAEAVVIALLAVLVAGLLRSHAEILRALHSLGAGIGEGDAGHRHRDVPVTFAPAASRRRPAAPGAGELDLGGRDGVAAPRDTSTAVFDVRGSTPDNEVVSVAVTPSRVNTLLAFLSGGCTSCSDFWNAFRDEQRLGLPTGTRLVVVTRGPGAESPSTIRRLAPPDVPVLMSDDAWNDYGVPGSPYFIYIDGAAGTITGEGSAPTWPDVVSLLREALDDAASTDRGLGLPGDEREARADRALMAAGILPGDPRLHPPVSSGEVDAKS